MWAHHHVGSKMAKEVVFMPATSLPTQFFLEVVVNHSALSKLKDKLTSLHKTLQNFFTETNR